MVHLNWDPAPNDTPDSLVKNVIVVSVYSNRSSKNYFKHALVTSVFFHPLKVRIFFCLHTIQRKYNKLTKTKQIRIEYQRFNVHIPKIVT